MSVQVGLKNLYYSLLTSDPVGGPPTYEAPVRIVGAITANINPNASNETLFFDDGPGETASTIGQIALELVASDLPLSVQAALLGHTIAAGVIQRKSTDIPPWVAIGFQSLKSNGKYRYTWLAKGKFAIPEQNNETKKDAINFQTPTISGSFVKRDSDDVWLRQGDEDEAGWDPAVATAWFTSPLGTGDTTPPTLSSTTPTDGQTLAAPATLVWTFSEPILLDDVNEEHFLVSVDSSGADKPGTYTKSGNTVIFTPSVAFAAVKHRFIAVKGIRDMSGNPLATTQTRTFTAT